MNPAVTPGKTIVFGGSGFLGSHVADELTDQGFDVTIFDLHPSPFLLKNQKMVVGNILDKAAVLEACRGADYIYNFAGLADIGEAAESAELTAQLNINGNINVLDAARANNVKRFVYASTVYVYSEAGSFYRVSKQASEKFVELYGERYKLPFCILRYGSLYGRRADHRNAIFRFVKDAIQKKQISYQGTGDEMREYIHVQDAAEASVVCLAEQYLNQHLTITGHQTFRVKDVMMMIAEILGKDVSLNFRNEDVEHHYSITPYAYKPRPGKKLTVNPFVDMGQGILDCIHEIAEKSHEQGAK